LCPLSDCSSVRQRTNASVTMSFRRRPDARFSCRPKRNVAEWNTAPPPRLIARRSGEGGGQPCVHGVARDELERLRAFDALWRNAGGVMRCIVRVNPGCYFAKSRCTRSRHDGGRTCRSAS
jgi:hypothetical protein